MLNIGFMQGRLSDMVEGKIQSFPFSNWEKEFIIGSENNFNIIEWTIDSIDIFNNPIIREDLHTKIIDLKNIYSVEIPSITCDFFMEKPFFKASNDKKIQREQFLLSFLKKCSNLNIFKIVIPLVDNGRIENLAHERSVLDFFLKHLDVLEKGNLEIIFESDLPPKKLKTFIDKFPAEFFGINYDTGNSASQGYNFLEEFDSYFDNIKNIHIKDRILNGSTVPLGEGNANLEKLLINLLNRNYSGNLILQTARDEKKHLEALCKYRNYVLNILSNYEKK
jgi:hexulose-6-phosphate isomerase